MNSKLFRSLFFAAMFILLLPVLSYGAEKKDYKIESANWNGTETAFYAEWEQPEDKTSFEVTLYIIKSGKNKKIKTVKTGGFSYDFTGDIVENKSGKYIFFVKPKKGSKTDGAYSDVFEIESDYLKILKASYIQKKEAEDPYYNKAYNADGTLKTVTVKYNEGKVPDGQIKELNIVSAGNCDVVSSSVDQPYEQWSMGTMRKVTVILKAKEGYTFTAGTEYKGNNLTYIGNKGDEKNRTVEFYFYPRIKLPGITGLSIDSDGLMKWDKVDKAAYYYLTLRNDENESLFSGKVKKNSFDLNDYIEDTESLQLYASNKSTGYIRSDTLKIEDFQAFRSENQLTGHFEKSGSAIRYLDENGEYVTGWNKIGGFWYYFDENHRMLTDTVTPDGYRVDANGRWIE